MRNANVTEEKGMLRASICWSGYCLAAGFSDLTAVMDACRNAINHKTRAPCTRRSGVL